MLRLFSVVVVVAGMCAVGAAHTQSPNLAKADESYIKARRDANKRELQHVEKTIKAARERYRRFPVFDAQGRHVGSEEARILSGAQGILQEESATLEWLKQRAEGKPLIGSLAANVRMASEEGQRAANQVPHLEADAKKRQDFLAFQVYRRASGVDLDRIKFEVAASELVVQAARHRLETADHFLLALGAPSIAEQRAAAQRAAEATRERQRAANARIQAARAETAAGVAWLTKELYAATAQATSERFNASTDDTGAGWSGSRDRFQAEGLTSGAFLEQVYEGTFRNAGRDYRPRVLLEGYIVKYSVMCGAHLPANKKELVVLQTEELVTKNGLGMTTSSSVVGQETIRTGIFAAPRFADAYLSSDWASFMGTLEALLSDPNEPLPLVGGMGRLIRESTSLRVDMRRIISRHGCDSPIVQRIGDNLLALVQ